MTSSSRRRGSGEHVVAWGADPSVAPRGGEVAPEVSDAQETTNDLVEAGAELVAPATRTPWDSLNSRLQGPAGLQLTLFQELHVDES